MSFNRKNDSIIQNSQINQNDTIFKESKENLTLSEKLDEAYSLYQNAYHQLQKKDLKSKEKVRNEKLKEQTFSFLAFHCNITTHDELVRFIKMKHIHDFVNKEYIPGVAPELTKLPNQHSSMLHDFYFSEKMPLLTSQYHKSYLFINDPLRIVYVDTQRDKTGKIEAKPIILKIGDYEELTQVLTTVKTQIKGSHDAFQYAIDRNLTRQLMKMITAHNASHTFKGKYHLKMLARNALAFEKKHILVVNQASRKKDVDYKTRMYSAKDRALMRVVINKGRFWNVKDLQVANTSSMISKEKKGYAAYVLNDQGEITIFSHHRMRDPGGAISHSSWNNGRPVISAGELVIDEKGRLKEMTMNSGHYKPDAKHLYFVLKLFQTSGLDLSQAKINDGKNEIPAYAFLQLFDNSKKESEIEEKKKQLERVLESAANLQLMNLQKKLKELTFISVKDQKRLLPHIKASEEMIKVLITKEDLLEKDFDEVNKELEIAYKKFNAICEDFSNHYLLQIKEKLRLIFPKKMDTDKLLQAFDYHLKNSRDFSPVKITNRVNIFLKKENSKENLSIIVSLFRMAHVVMELSQGLSWQMAVVEINNIKKNINKPKITNADSSFKKIFTKTPVIDIEESIDTLSLQLRDQLQENMQSLRKKIL